MIPSTTAYPGIRIFPANPPFLPFWAWSGLFHLIVLTLLSVVYHTNPIEPMRSTVKVTLIETPLASPSPQPPAPAKRDKPAPKTPPLLNSPRPMPLLAQQPIPVTQALETPSVQTTVTKISPPSQPINTIQPIKRQVLRDTRATDNLNLKNLLKVAQRTPTSPSTAHQGVQPPLGIVPSAAVPPSSLFSPSTPQADSRSQQPLARSLTPNVLKATAPGTGNISKSKVGLGRTIPPVYPRIARESGWEGTVLVRVAVQPDGRPDTIQVRKSSGYSILDNAAIEAVKKWRFLPAKDGNIPIRSVVDIPINFDLRKQG